MYTCNYKKQWCSWPITGETSVVKFSSRLVNVCLCLMLNLVILVVMWNYDPYKL